MKVTMNVSQYLFSHGIRPTCHECAMFRPTDEKLGHTYRDLPVGWCMAQPGDNDRRLEHHRVKYFCKEFLAIVDLPDVAEITNALAD